MEKSSLVTLFHDYLHTRHSNFDVSVLNNYLFIEKGSVSCQKVFAIQDPSLPLETYQDQLSKIKNRLAGASNVLPFHLSIITDKASFLIRQLILSKTIYNYHRIR